MLDPTPVDGRVARGERARGAVIEALLDLLSEGIPSPTAAQIAERAGCSLRLVFHHFADLERIHAEAADRQAQRIAPLFRRVAAHLPRERKIAEFVKTRAQLFETISPVRRAAIRLEPFSSELERRLRAARAVVRDDTHRVFAAELAQFKGPEQREVFAALEAATSWETWEALRHRQELGETAARRAMERIIRALLAKPR